MPTVLCRHGGYCVRVLGHRGAHTACPSAATLDWDHDKSPIAQRHIDTAVTLLALDFPAPHWADLRDDVA
jgi:hypothetical protein